MLKLMRKHTKLIMGVVIAFFMLSIFAGYGMYSRSGGGGGERDYAVAKINGKKVMRSAVDNTMVRIAEQMRLSEISEADWLNLRQLALDNIAIQSELEKEIKNRKLDITKDEIESAYVNVMDSYPTREAFKEFLERSGLKEQDIKNDIKNQLQQEKIIQALTSEINVPEEDAREFYEITKSFIYKQDKGFMINIASFRTRETAEKARAEIAAGVNWDAMLEENKNQLMASTMYNSPFAMSEQVTEQDSFKILKDYPLNKVSPVLTVTDGEFAIVIKRSETEERILPFEDVSQDVFNSVRSQQSEKLFTDLRDRAKIEILDASVFPSDEAPQDENPEASKDVN